MYFGPVESNSNVHLRRPAPEYLDNPEKREFFQIIGGFWIRLTEVDTRFRFNRSKKLINMSTIRSIALIRKVQSRSIF